MWVHKTLIQPYEPKSDELKLFSLRWLDANRNYDQVCQSTFLNSVQLPVTMVLKEFPSTWQVTTKPDVIKVKSEEYVVEFRVTIVDPEYSRLLSDPNGPQHDVIKQRLTAKVTFDLRGLEDSY